MAKALCRLLLYLALLSVLFSAPLLAVEAGYQRSTVIVSIPDVVLVNQNGEKIRLKNLLADPAQPVIGDFIYGTCTTICS